MRDTTYPSLQHQWFEEVWNQGLESSIDELCTEDVVAHGLVDAEGNEITGREQFKAFFRQFRSAFPDIKIEIEHRIEQGDMIAVYCLVKATHSGPGFLGAPSGKAVEFCGMSHVRVVDGFIAESWNCFDFLALGQQVDAIQINFRE